jgi:hypothetical protein
MPNSIGPDGLVVKTQAELVDQFTTALEAIFGSDIDVGSSTPDGQWMMEIVQCALDLEDLLVQINNMFDPDFAVGVILDQRVAINGIQRQAGTFTVTNVTLVISQALNLFGIDQETQAPFTVADNAGNQFVLQTTQNIASPGTYVFSFQALSPGAVQTIPNTITVPVTIVLGVTSINNPTPAITTGINEESDVELKVRRQKSVSLASQGYLAGLLAALENINGVTSAFVYENNTDSTDGDGTPSHSIWVIVAGTGADADIANAIYTKRNAGCGMRGNISYTIVQVNGIPFNVRWDIVIAQTLFISFTATSIDGVNPPNVAAIRAGLPLSFVPGVNQEVDINHLATQVQVIDPNTLVTDAGFSNGETQILTLSGVAASGVFRVNYNGHQSANINWNDSIGTIQSKVQAVTGLDACLVTGSIASQTLTFDLSAISQIQGLITITNNTLATSAPVAITFAFNFGYSTTLEPSAKNRQFIVSAANILITPMTLTPSSVQVLSGGTQTFVGAGGYGTLTYAFQTNNSGGTINGSSGLYTAGGVGSVTDTVKVTDLYGNVATATISVI